MVPRARALATSSFKVAATTFWYPARLPRLRPR